MCILLETRRLQIDEEAFKFTLIRSENKESSKVEQNFSVWTSVPQTLQVWTKASKVLRKLGALT